MVIANPLIDNIKTYILNPIVIFLFGLALILFLYGLIEFLMDVSAGGKKEEGKKNMFWGIVGLVIMISAYGIEEFIINTIKQLTGSH